jgi:hypothetical protein
MTSFGPDVLLATLRAAAFVLTVAGGGETLRIAPATRLTPQQRAALHREKGPILRLLRQEAEEAAASRRAPHDPRPDLDAAQHDAVWWSVLLALALEVHGADDPRGVYGALQGSRCLGAALARSSSGALRIVPGAIAPAEWRDLRVEWLVPHRTAITELLVAVAAAEQLLTGQLADDTSTFAEVRQVWPEARALTPAEMAAIETLPVVDWRRWPRTLQAQIRTGDQS